MQNQRLLTLDEAKKNAARSTKKRARNLWIISKLLVSKTEREYGFLCHCYLRWVDDFIDITNNSINEKREFLKLQLKNIENIYAGKVDKYKRIEEDYMYYIIQYAKNEKKEFIIDAVKNIILSLIIDVGRIAQHKTISEKELENYIHLLIKSLFNPIYLFLTKGTNDSTSNNFIGIFSWYVLALRDFNEDYDSGLLNITQEEIKKYNLNIAELFEDNNFKHWVKDKVSFTFNIMEKEVIILSKMNFKVKLFWTPSFMPRIIELNRIKFYNYSLFDSPQKTPGNELKIFVISIYQIISVFIKVFFK